MAEGNQTQTFQIAVSDKRENKLGVGGTSRLSERLLYFYAESSPEGGVSLQALNANHCPSGAKRKVAFQEFLEDYHPEPLFYYNKVRPVMTRVETNLKKGDEHLDTDRPDLAEKCFRRVLAIDEENIHGVFGLGLAYLAAGKLDAAEEILGKLMNLEMAFSQEHSHLFNRFGIQMRKAGMHQQALDYYRRALELSGDDEHLHFNTCRIHYELGEYGSAMACIVKALALNAGFREGESMFKFLVRTQPECAAFLEQQEAEALRKKYEHLDLDGLPWEES